MIFPVAVVTKKIIFTGWKRFEMNGPSGTVWLLPRQSEWSGLACSQLLIETALDVWTDHRVRGWRLCYPRYHADCLPFATLGEGQTHRCRRLEIDTQQDVVEKRFGLLASEPRWCLCTSHRPGTVGTTSKTCSQTRASPACLQQCGWVFTRRRTKLVWHGLETDDSAALSKWPEQRPELATLEQCVLLESPPL